MPRAYIKRSQHSRTPNQRKNPPTRTSVDIGNLGYSSPEKKTRTEEPKTSRRQPNQPTEPNQPSNQHSIQLRKKGVTRWRGLLDSPWCASVSPCLSRATLSRRGTSSPPDRATTRSAEPRVCCPGSGGPRTSGGLSQKKR